MRCPLGNPVELRAVFKHRKTGKPFQPHKVVCTVEQPDGTILTPTAAPEAGEGAEEGAYVAEITPTIAGKWEYAFDGFDEDGEPVASKEDDFHVEQRQVPRD
jgi:hypothetical protein